MKMNKNKNNLEQCIWNNIAEHQRETEILNGYGLRGTEVFKKAGCYNCTGYDKNKSCYTIIYKELELKIKNELNKHNP